MSNHITEFASKLVSKDLLERITRLHTEHVLTSPYYLELCNDKYGEELNASRILDKKIYHTIAALGFIESTLKPDGIITDDTILGIILFELTQVDFVDTISEEHWMRNLHSELKLFNNSKKSILYGNDEDLFEWETVPKELVPGLRKWQTFIFSLTHKFSNIMRSYPEWQLVKPHIDTRLTNYYHFIAFAHCTDRQDKETARNWLIEHTYNKDLTNFTPKTDWVTNPNLWCTFFGESISFLIPIYLITSLNLKNALGYSTKLSRCYRAVGILNVVLDDIIDVTEDEKNNDPNLVTEFSKGDYAEDLINMRKYLKYDFEVVKSPVEVLIEAILKQTREDLEITNLPTWEAIEPFNTIVNRMFRLYYGLAVHKNIPDHYIRLLEKYLNGIF